MKFVFTGSGLHAFRAFGLPRPGPLEILAGVLEIAGGCFWLPGGSSPRSRPGAPVARPREIGRRDPGILLTPPLSQANSQSSYRGSTTAPTQLSQQVAR